MKKGKIGLWLLKKPLWVKIALFIPLFLFLTFPITISFLIYPLGLKVSIAYLCGGLVYLIYILWIIPLFIAEEE